MGEKQFLTLKLNKQMEDWSYWSFCSFGWTWVTEISLSTFPYWTGRVWFKSV